jgi:hypothetical protein|tara:strand:+ start:1751 stop:1942 length:192 start_codon:yes stop_codon:yes gene_type:complete
MKYTKTKTEKKLLKKVTINVTISDLEIEILKYNKETLESKLINEHNERYYNDEIHLVIEQNFG